jgi:hypothetical protein
MREIKFRAWDKEEERIRDWKNLLAIGYGPNKIMDSEIDDSIFNDDQFQLMQFTGLYDKNGLTDIYEGDILDENGLVRGNIYETPDKRTTDFVIKGMGTKEWRDTEQEAMGRGCRYSE